MSASSVNSSGGFTLASAADCIHVWHMAAGSTGTDGKQPAAAAAAAAAPPQLHAPPHPARTLRPHNGGRDGHSAASIRAIQWNHNNGVLGSGGGEGSDGTICLSNVADGKVMMRLPPTASAGAAEPAYPATPVAALAFSSGSRYLCAAGGASSSEADSAQVVSIWDLKKHVRSRRLVGHSGAVTALDLGAQDAHVASVSLTGEILVHNLSLAALSCKMLSAATSAATGGTVALRDVQHSPHKKHVLGVCGDAGVVELFDCNTATLTATLRPPPSMMSSSPHTAASDAQPLSALRFSPTSAALCASVGLDKRLSFYDVTSRKCIRNVMTDYALSCLDYHSDGCTLLLGTMAGHLLLYDIRNAAKPVAKILNAHPGRPVNAVKFAHAHVPVPTTTTTAAPQQPSSPSSRASAGTIQRNGGGNREHHSSGTSSAVYDTKATTFIDNIASAAADSAPAAASTSGSFSARAPHHQHAHNATLPPSSAPSSSTAFNYSTAAAAMNQTVPSGFAAAPTTDLFSPVKDASAAAAQPASTPTGVHQLHSNRSYANPASAATASSLGLGFISPLAAGGGNHASTADYGNSGGDSTPQHLQHTGAATASARPSHLSTSTPNGHASTDYSSAAFFASSHAGALVPAPSATSPSRGSSRSALAAVLQPSPSSASMHAAAAAGHSTFASPAPSPAAAAASSRHHGTQGSFDGAAAAASGPGDGTGGALSEYHMRALRSLLDDSLHSLRSELRGAVTDLHVEMLKQFHQAQMEQQQQLEQFAQRFESMLGEVKQLRDDYQQLKHIY
jgi:WD40 repeat protein